MAALVQDWILSWKRLLAGLVGIASLGLMSPDWGERGPWANSFWDVCAMRKRSTVF